MLDLNEKPINLDEGYIEADFDDETQSLNLNINYSYPNNPDYDIVAYLERINLDKEKERDLQTNKGFIVSSPKPTIKKDIKNPDSIFSTFFGQRLGDLNPYIDRHSCVCGELRGKDNDGIMCSKCGSICKEVGDDFSKFGWIEIVPEYSIIHPDIYKQLEVFFGSSKYTKNKRMKRGSVLDNIIDYDKEIDQDGKEVGPKIKPNEPFYGIGMVEFRERFDEIMSYYLAKNKKQEIYDDIMADRDLVFTNSIPVYTTLLRPLDISANTMYYEKTNGYYSMMVKQAFWINKNKRKIDRTPKMKNQQLYRFQKKYMELYDEIINIVSDKRGEFRSLVSGRFTYSARSVIKQNPDLRIDQVELPYAELVITQQQRIINVLHRTFNISFQEAYDKWSKAIGTVDDTIVNILKDIIRNSCNGEGIPVLKRKTSGVLA